MKNITITRTKNTVNAPYLPYAAYIALAEGASKRNAQIANNADHTTVVTCNSIKDAKDLVAEWTANYNANRKVEVAPAPKSVPAQKTPSSKPTATKGKTKATTSSTKKTTAPRKAKGNAFDYSVIKGETKKDKNRALHAMLVSMGHADSRTKEYQAVWSARPWAK